MPHSPLPTGAKLVQEGVDSFRLSLPRRLLGRFRWIGLAPLIFGLGIGGFFYTWLSDPVEGLIRTNNQGIELAFSLVFVLLGLPGLVFGSALVILGLALLSEQTHSEIAVHHHHLRVIEHFGFLRWSWVRPSAGRISISLAQATSHDAPSGFGAISLSLDDGKGLLFAIGYPLISLRPLAENLTHLLNSANLSSSFDPQVQIGSPDEEDTEDSETNPVFSRTPLPLDENQVEEALPMPADTTITLTSLAQGEAIAIPPSGFKGAAAVLIVIGSLFSIPPLAILIAGFVHQNNFDIGPILFLILFDMVGNAMLLGGIHSARKRYLLAVREDGLAIRTLGLFKTREQAVPQEEIAAIHIGPSGVTVNDVPVMELQIERKAAASKIGLMSNRRNDEILWVANRLRRILHVGAETRFEVEAPSDEPLRQPLNSKIAITRDGEVEAFTIPPVGFTKGGSLFFLVFGLLWSGFVLFAMTLVIRNHESVGILLFLGIFLAIGLLMLGGAIQGGTQRFLLAVTPDRMAYQKISLFGTSKHQIMQTDISAISVGPSGTVINGKPVPELKIETREQGTIPLLAGRSAEELVWIAQSLRTSLKIDYQAAKIPHSKPMA